VKLRDVLTAGHVIAPLEAASVRQATERLADRLIQAGAVAAPQRLLAVIQHAWPEDMVSVGEHAFLPHFRTESVDHIAVALGVATRPVRWDKAPHRSARIVILIVAPPRETTTYLQVVGALARALSDPETVLAMLAAKSPEQVVALPALRDAELPGQLTVRDVMTPQVHTVKGDCTLGEVARMMVERDIRAVPVVDEGGGLLGIVTHRELLRHLVPEFQQRAKSGEHRRTGTDPQLLPVREAMSRSVLCLSDEQPLADVASLMNSKDVDRFPVVRDGVLVGFLTRADLIRRLLTLQP
jgi:CBS domain-containing protein/mannitol/fructose-specific phosphotransferase system IIA component (Ntr-type)